MWETSSSETLMTKASLAPALASFASCMLQLQDKENIHKYEN